MELFLSAVLSLGSAVYFFRVARESDAQSRSRAVLQPYGTPDAVFATILVLWFLTNILGSTNRVVIVNTQLLVFGAILSFLLITFLLCFLILRSRNPLDLFGLRGISWKPNLRAACFGLVAALARHLLHPHAELPFFGGRSSTATSARISWPSTRACTIDFY